MEKKKNKRAKTSKQLIRYNNCILPQLNSNTPLIYKQKRSKLSSAEQNKKFKLDSKKFKVSINKKKEQIFSLEKKCEILKDQNKFNDEIIKEMLTTNNKDNKDNINKKQKTKTFEITNYNIKRDINIVKDYKENKKILENVKNQYIMGKIENKKIKNEIEILDEDIKDIENKINQKKNDIFNIKNKIKITEKNSELIEELRNKKNELEKQLKEKNG